MKPLNQLNEKQDQNPSLSRQEEALYEQLALQRLKQLQSDHPPGWNSDLSWRSLWKGIQQILEPFRQPELIRQVGPDLPPMRRHEWEKSDPRKSIY